jgi:predicted CXXCH cytochrome family protein
VKADVPVPTHVGGSTCAECHAQEAAKWRGSDHDLAMQEVSAKTVLGDFGDAEFTQFDVTTRFVRDGERFLVRTEGPDGKTGDFPVKYVFGIRPLQQYLIELPAGRLQAFPIAWDTERKRWFSLYPEERTKPGDPLHWTGWALNWNQGCAYCHSTNLDKGYDATADVYRTAWAEIDVSCEACHGPGSAHVKWARALAAETPEESAARDSATPPRGDAGPVAGSAKPALLDQAGLLLRLSPGPFADRRGTPQPTQIEMCARCHARRSVMQGNDRLDRPFLDAWVPELLRPGRYHADGQVLDEVYEYGSFLQSRMFHEGVVCSDCHDPHSLKLVAEGNALCTQCHDAARYDASVHSHHPAGSVGAQCVSCHMRAWPFMQVDPRRDHGFHLPRPDLTVELGVPNACSGCHTDESPEWARDQVLAWFGPERPPDRHATTIIAAGRKQEPSAEQQLAAVVGDAARPEIVRATALELLRGYGGAAAGEAARRALRDPSPLLRGVAAGNAATVAASPEELEELLAPLLDDSSRYVRMEAAQNLSRIASERLAQGNTETARLFWKALAEYREGQNASLDQPGAHLNLGVIHQNLGEGDAARKEYQEARQIDATFVPARFNLAMFDAIAGRKEEAEAEFRQVIRLAPDFAEAHYSLGLLLGEDQNRMAESSDALRRAAQLAPANARMQYNAGLGAQHLGRHGEAEPYLRAAVQLEPGNPQFVHALAVLYAQQQRWNEAVANARRLVEILPQEPRARELLQGFERQAAAAGAS